MAHPPIDAQQMRARLRDRYEELGARNQHLEQEARRARRRTLVLGASVAWLFCMIGLAGVGAALHTTNAELGWVFFWGGLAVGNGGMLATFIGTIARLRSRGDE